jgi:ribonucleotide reductase alpha subunit
MPGIEARFRELSHGLDDSIDSVALTDTVCGALCDGASEEDVDNLMAETAAYHASMHPDFAKLAARVAVARLHRKTEPSLLRTLHAMCDHAIDGVAAPLVTAELVETAERMAPALEAAIRHERDYEYDYFGLRTLQRSYLRTAADGASVERPQHMLMRVALAVHGTDEPAVLQAYDMMSRGLFTHATPTLFNAGTARQQLCSCFLLAPQEDSVAGIFESLRQCALISRDAGGIGLAVSNIRASQSCASRSRATYSTSARFTYDGGHFSS